MTDAELLEKIAELTGKPWMTKGLLVSLHRGQIDWHMNAMLHIASL